MVLGDSAPDRAPRALSPIKQEALRCEMAKKQHAATRRSAEKLLAYTARNTRSGPTPLDKTQLLTNTHVQDHHALAGQRTTVPSSRPDAGFAKCNMLRYQRNCGYTDQIPLDGGRTYTCTSLNDNCFEERRDVNYRPGWHPKELRLNKLWDTEHTASYVMHNPAYAAKVVAANVVAKQPVEKVEVVGVPVRPGPPGGPTDNVNYARFGFGPDLHQDHTNAFMRGAHHVGIAPYKLHDSIAKTTCGKAEPLEWQLHRGKFTNTVPASDKWTMKAHHDLAVSQAWPQAWQSTYKADLVDHSKAMRRVAEARFPPSMRTPEPAAA